MAEFPSHLRSFHPTWEGSLLSRTSPGASCTFRGLFLGTSTMLNWREQGMWMFCVLMIWHLFNFLTKNEQDFNREGTENTIIYLRKDRRKGWMFSDTCSDWIFLNNYNSLKKKKKSENNQQPSQNKPVDYCTKQIGYLGHRKNSSKSTQGSRVVWAPRPVLVPNTNPVILSVLCYPRLVLGAPHGMPKPWYKTQLLTQGE